MDPFEIKRYPVTKEDVEASWKHQVRWQIYFPLGMGLLILALLIGLLIASQVGDASVWADIATIALLALAIVLGLVGLIIIAMGAVGVIYLIREIPAPLDRTREVAFDAQEAMNEASQTAVKPVIVPRAATHAFISGVRYLAGIFKG